MKVVHIYTGEVITPKWVSENGKRFSDKLTAKGQPDMRRGTFSVGLYKFRRETAPISGTYAVYDPATEAKAQPIRDEINQLKNKIEQLKKDLAAVYPYEVIQD